MAITTNFSTKVIGLVNDLTSADKVNINEAIFQETFALSKFPTAHTMRSGVRDGNVIPIVLNGTNYCSMPASDPTSCDLPEGNLNLNFSAKKWDLAEYAERIPICMRQFDEQFLAFWNMYRQRLDNPDHHARCSGVFNLYNRASRKCYHRYTMACRLFRRYRQHQRFNQR